MATQRDLNKILNLKKQGDIKRLLGKQNPKGTRKPLQSEPKISAMQNIEAEEKEVRMFFENVDPNDIEQFKSELTRFMNSKSIWKGRRTFFTRFLNEIPENLFVKFSQLYLNQPLNFKEFFDTKFKPKYIDKNIMIYGKYDEIMRSLFTDYIINPLKYLEQTDKLRSQMSAKFIDMLDSFLDINKNEKRYFAQKYVESKYPYDEFYIRYKAGTLDGGGGEPNVEQPNEEPNKQQEPSKAVQNRVPLMIDENGNVVPVPTGYNLYKFNRPRNRLPIVSEKEFQKKLDKLKEIPGEVVDLAKIELKTNLGLSSNKIDDILIGLLEKYNSFESFVKKLGKIIFYYSNQFIIRNQNNKLASLYKTRIQNDVFNMKGIAYATKYDFLPELFEFDDDSNSESKKQVKKVVKKQIEVFLKNFKIKLYAFIINTSAKIKNINSGFVDVVILADERDRDYTWFGYTDNGRKYFNIRNIDSTMIPSDVESHISKVYNTKIHDGEVPVAEPDEVPQGQVPTQEEEFDVQQLYEDFVMSLKNLNIGQDLFSDSEGENGSPSPLFTESDNESRERTNSDFSDVDSPRRNRDSSEECLCKKCGVETDRSLKTKIKDGNQYKTVCFCSFKCFEKFKN
jgi:hypothetical protein